MAIGSSNRQNELQQHQEQHFAASLNTMPLLSQNLPFLPPPFPHVAAGEMKNSYVLFIWHFLGDTSMRKTKWEKLQNMLQQQLLQLQQKVPTFNALPLHSQTLMLGTCLLSIIYYPGPHFEVEKTKGDRRYPWKSNFFVEGGWRKGLEGVRSLLEAYRTVLNFYNKNKSHCLFRTFWSNECKFNLNASSVAEAVYGSFRGSMVSDANANDWWIWDNAAAESDALLLT